jgi:twinkle protein
MALSLDDLVGTMNEKQKALMIKLDALAKKYHIHILIIAHPRKEANFQLLRKESISGTSDLTNIVWNVLLIHRVGDDFEKRATEFWGKERTNKLILEGYNNIIEIAKNRDYGVVDFVVGLYYEIETKRFKNSKAEQIHYDWEEHYEEYSVPEEPQPLPTTIQPNQAFDTPIEPLYTQKDEDAYWGQFRNDTDNCPF